MSSPKKSFSPTSGLQLMGLLGLVLGLAFTFQAGSMFANLGFKSLALTLIGPMIYRLILTALAFVAASCLRRNRPWGVPLAWTACALHLVSALFPLVLYVMWLLLPENLRGKISEEARALLKSEPGDQPTNSG